MTRPGKSHTRVAVLGGTFDHLHRGHEALLRAAFRSADEVRIGVTTPAYLRHHPKIRGALIEPYPRRVERLETFLRRTFPGRVFRIRPLEDPFGGSLSPGVDTLVVSAATLRGGRRVNRERRRLGRPPLNVIEVPLVRAEDGRPVSSRRIRSGRIDPDGHLVHPIPPRRTTADRRGVPSAGRTADTSGG